jgi:sigma-E factor negative regulatory protein RseA
MGSIMGSVSMQSQAGSRSERLSAVVDGEWLGEFGSLNEFFSDLDHEDRAAWSHYHLIGDALRSDDLTMSPVSTKSFAAGFAARLAAEPHVLAPAAMPYASRLLSLRRRVVPAFAVAAAAATLTWIVVPQLQGTPGNARVVSVSSSSGDSMQRVAIASVPAAIGPGMQESNIIRDASLDQYLEAHQQFGQQPVVTGSMPLIRAAALSTVGR